MSKIIADVWEHFEESDEDSEEIIDELDRLRSINWCFAQMLDDVSEEECPCEACSDDGES